MGLGVRDDMRMRPRHDLTSGFRYVPMRALHFIMRQVVSCLRYNNVGIRSSFPPLGIIQTADLASSCFVLALLVSMTSALA